MNKENKIFEELRKIPTELSEEKMEQMIKGFSGIPLQPQEPSIWKNLLTIKNIIMITIPFSIAIGLLLFNPVTNETTTITETSQPLEIETKTEVNNLVADILLPKKKSKIETKEALEKKKSIAPVILTTPKVIEAQENHIQPTNSIPDIIGKKAKPIDLTVHLQNIDEKVKSKSSPKQGTSVSVLDLNPDFERMSILSDSKMKRIRKILYKNLLEDGLIPSKFTSVEMKLPGDKIYVNGKEIPAELFQKYADLTYEIKSGPNRKIKIDKKYIIIGDFNLNGFVGTGLGTFDDALLEKGFAKDDTFDIEYKALFDFAKSIRTPAASKPSLFGVNLNDKNCNLLKEQLYMQLKEDQLINNEHDFILIQHQTDKLIINGIVLSKNQKSIYQKLISEFKIKPGKNREILLSNSMICVGDCINSTFTGTIFSID